MHNVMAEQMRWLVAEPDQSPIVSAKQNAMPQLTWKKGALVIKALPQMDLIKADKSAISDLFINLDIALKFGLVLQKTSQNKTWYPLGPNMQYTLPTKTYDSTTQPAGNQFRRAYNWEGAQYMGVNPTLLFGNTGRITNDPLQVVTQDGVKFLQLSLIVEWQLNNLDASFEKIVGTRKRTVMVYLDLVESTVVGSGKFPLPTTVDSTRSK